MAKSIRRIFTMILAICICTCMIAPQALAAEITTETTTEGGITTTVTTTTDTVVDGDTSTTTETVETEKTGTDADGADIVYEETTTTTTTTEADGTVTEEKVTEGSETKEWTGDVEVGDENQPEVEVELIPGEKTSNSASDTSTDVTGDVPENEDDTEYDYTESEVVIDKTVTAETTDVKVEVVESEADIDALAPEKHDDKAYSAKEGLLSGLTGQELIGYTGDYDQPDADGYDFQFTGYGEATNALRAQSGYVKYLRDEDGNVKLDENGNPIVESITFTDRYEDGMGSTPAIFALTKYDEEGNAESYYYAYCIDNDTEALGGAWYRISNLEDSDYYPDPANSDKLRAVAMNGYWGQESGMGSYTEMRDKILAHYGADAEITVEDKDGNPVTYTVGEVLEIMTEADALTMTQAAIWSYSNGALATKDGVDGKSVLGVYSVIKPKSNLADVDRIYNTKRDALLKAGYEWLISVPAMPAPESTTVINEDHFIEDTSLVVGDKVETVDGENDVYDVAINFALGFTPGTEDNLIIQLKYTDNNNEEQTVERRLAGEKAEGEELERLEADENGRYTIGGLNLAENKIFNFSLTLKGTQKLENGVYIYESYVGETTGNLVSGDPAKGQGEVYHNESQTFVGIASGTQNVEVTASVGVTFSVDENKGVTENRVWYNEEDPIVTPPEVPDTPDNPDDNPVVPPAPPVTPPQQPTPPAPPAPPAPTAPVYIPDDAVPQAVMEVDGEVIIDEEVPLADVPATGDNSALWLLLSAAVIIGLVLVNLSNKKRTEA